MLEYIKHGFFDLHGVVVVQKNYQMTSGEGDIVRMPNGTIGIVSHTDIIMAGNCKEVRVFPFTNWLHRFFLTLAGKTWFHDREINNLKPIYLTPRS